MKSLLLLVIGAALILGVYYYFTASSTTPAPTPTPQAQVETESPIPARTESGTVIAKTYTKTEVANHKTAEDCWLIIDGGVYDVTEFIDKHPGGKVITLGCGKDASIFFHARGEKKEEHSAKAVETREKYRVGNLGE